MCKVTSFLVYIKQEIKKNDNLRWLPFFLLYAFNQNVI